MMRTIYDVDVDDVNEDEDKDASLPIAEKLGKRKRRRDMYARAIPPKMMLDQVRVILSCGLHMVSTFHHEDYHDHTISSFSSSSSS